MSNIPRGLSCRYHRHFSTRHRELGGVALQRPCEAGRGGFAFLALVFGALLATSPAGADQTASYLVIFRCSEAVHATLFAQRAIANVVPDDHSRFDSFTAREVLASATGRSPDEFEQVFRCAAYGISGSPTQLLTSDGDGFAFAVSPFSSGVRVALYAMSKGRPTRAAGVADVRPGEAAVIRLTLEGMPCVGVMRAGVFPAFAGADSEWDRRFRKTQDDFRAPSPGVHYEFIEMKVGEASRVATRSLARLESR